MFVFDIICFKFIEIKTIFVHFIQKHGGTSGIALFTVLAVECPIRKEWVRGTTPSPKAGLPTKSRFMAL